MFEALNITETIQRRSMFVALSMTNRIDIIRRYEMSNEETPQKCPKCGYEILVKAGIQSEKQRYRCRMCGKVFVMTETTEKLIRLLRDIECPNCETPFNRFDQALLMQVRSAFLIRDSKGNLISPNIFALVQCEKCGKCYRGFPNERLAETTEKPVRPTKAQLRAYRKVRMI